MQVIGDLQILELVAVLPETPRFPCLAVQGLHLLLDFSDDVTESHQVLFDSVQLVERGFLFRLVLADSGGLFKDGAPLLRVGLEQDVDLSLLDHRIGVVGNAGAQEELTDISQAAAGLVEEVLALAGPIQPASYAHLVEIDGEEVLRVREDEGGLSIAEGFPVCCPIEDDVRHL